MNRTEHNRNVITLKLLQFLVTVHTYTTIYNFGDKKSCTHMVGLSQMPRLKALCLPIGTIDR